MGKHTNKTEKISVTLDADGLKQMRLVADARFGGNISAAINNAMLAELENGRGMAHG